MSEQELSLRVDAREDTIRAREAFKLVLYSRVTELKFEMSR